MRENGFKQLKAFTLYTKTLVMMSSLSDENIGMIVRMITDYYSGKARPDTDDIDNAAVSMLIDELCDCLDDAEVKRQRKSDAGKAGMNARYNTDITEEQNKANTVITEQGMCYNSDITTKTNTKTKTNTNTKIKTDTNTRTTQYILSSKLDSACQNDRFSDEINEIVEYLNEKTGKHYSPKAEATRKHIRRRMEEGYTVEDFKRAIDNKSQQWLGTDKEMYLRPTTLFNSEKFEGYANEDPTQQEPKTKMQEDCEKIAGWLERRHQK